MGQVITWPIEGTCIDGLCDLSRLKNDKKNKKDDKKSSHSVHVFAEMRA